MAARTSGSVMLSEATPPLYVVHFVGVATDAEFRAYLDHMLRVTMRRELHAMVFDASEAGLIPPAQRKLQADWMREYDKLNRETTAACAFVLPNPLMRGLLTAILWLHPMPCPYGVFADLPSATQFCERHLSERGITVRRPGA